MKKLAVNVLLVSAIGGSAVAQNIVTNGGFEGECPVAVSQDFSFFNVDPAPNGWSFQESDMNPVSFSFENSYTGRTRDPNAGAPVNAQSGQWYVSLGAFSQFGSAPTSLDDYDSLSQQLITQANEEYKVSYWIYTTGGDYFNVTWNGQVIQGSQITNGTDSGGWKKVDLSVFSQGSFTTLALNGFNNASYVNVDNVSVTQAVPEPGELMALPLALAFVARKRKK